MDVAPVRPGGLGRGLLLQELPDDGVLSATWLAEGEQVVAVVPDGDAELNGRYRSILPQRHRAVG